MKNAEFFKALDMIEEEKGIPADYMLEKVEAALLAAAKRAYGTADNASVLVNRDKNEIKLLQKKTVVEEVADPVMEITLEEAHDTVSKRLKLGDEALVEVKTKEFGRIAAQNAKQVIIHGIRDGERGLLYQEFNSKECEILTTTVNRVEPNGNAILDIGKSQAMLIRNEQIPGEVLNPGDFVKIYVVEVRTAQKGPQILISRTHPGLVKRLFELEVPEIFDGSVEVKAIAREAGSRTKIAVYSHDENVDPVGACIGTRGMRISKICEELKGEKVDIIRYSENAEEYIAAALAPAKIISVAADDAQHTCVVVVSDDQLSLAIGKEGQNARLAAKLTGYKIDIKPLSKVGE
ncbi:MAG: transcription termination/antitermination protein NusA [Clostridiales bacterium]|nr:MAG: transcription termination/antitermination protein NusA [Clostridiales bacterium]